MVKATFRFVGKLNDFLREQDKGTAIPCTFNNDQSVKHMIESLGIPHTEVGSILVNGGAVDFGYLVGDGDQVEAYPQGNYLSDEGQNHEPRFVLDIHLGRLAHYLRMFGFDTLYRNDYHDDELADISAAEDRILLTRDRRLLMRSKVLRGYWVRHKIPRQQIVEVLRRYDLCERVSPFRRCIHCNGLLQPISKEEVLHRLEPLTKKYYQQFRICPDCERIFWQGSHYERMLRFIDQVMVEARQ
jgi:uncharacterized protein with PIN domain